MPRQVIASPGKDPLHMPRRLPEGLRCRLCDSSLDKAVLSHSPLSSDEHLEHWNASGMTATQAEQWRYIVGDI